MGARCCRQVSRTTRPDGSTRPRRWRFIPTARATTVRGHPMRNIRTRAAFTLAEGLIASVILALAVGGIIAPISASYQQTRTVKQTSIAISMAQQLLDEILSKPY